MGPAMLITIGVLFLLQMNTRWSFDETWPVILIVIGVIQVLAHSASIEGHVQPRIAQWVEQRIDQRMSPPPANPSSASTPPAAPSSSSSGGGGTNHV